MDRSITLRFYEISRAREDTPHLADVLRHIAETPLERRWRGIGTGIRVRLERFEQIDDDICGEFTREQSENFPSLVTAAGVSALPIEEGDGELGHGIAFRFRPPNTFAVQFDPRALSPSRLLEYLYAFEPSCQFRIRVKLSGDEWERFNSKPIRKLDFTIASPTDLTRAQNREAPALSAVRQLGDDYQAPYIKVSLGMGHRAGELPEAVRELARTLFDQFSSHRLDLRRLRATAYEGEGEGSDEINLIDDIVSVPRELNYRKNDPDYNYRLRRNLLARLIHLYV